MAKKGAQALRSVHGTNYDIGTGADLMYEASGGSDDWAKGAAKVEMTYS